MEQQGQITFYTHPYSPVSHRVRIALEEVGAKYNTSVIDISNKPAWFVEKVNPVTGTVPAITYGGPEGPPDQPPAGSAAIWESFVINEFLADIFPSSNLLPTDPVKRANARMLLKLYETKIHDATRGFIAGVSPGEKLLDAYEMIQARLSPEGFAIGEFSVVDCDIAPSFVRIEMYLSNEIGKYPVGEGAKVLEQLKGPRFERLMRYIADLKARPSIQRTFDEAKALEILKTEPAFRRPA